MVQADRIVGREHEWKSVSICTKSIRIVESILHIRRTICILLSEREREVFVWIHCEFLFDDSWKLAIYIQNIYIKDRKGSKCFIFTALALLLLLFLMLFFIFLSHCKARIPFFALLFIPFCALFVYIHIFLFVLFLSFVFSIPCSFTISMRCNIIVLALHFAIANIFRPFRTDFTLIYMQ